VRRRLALALIAGLALFAAPSASASRNFLGGILDEPSTLGNPDWAFPQYKSLGVQVLRVQLYWGGPSGVARKRRPANAVNPADPAYDWSVYDAFVKRAAENQIKPLFSILWTPGWAGPRQNHAPRRMIDLRNFAFAAAKRYSGSFRPTPDATPLPAVRLWTAWNEPNNPIFLQPQFVRAGKAFRPESPRVYAQICNAIWSGVHLTGFVGEKVACGVTAPRGNNSGRQPRPSISPIYFLRGMKKAGAHFDVYAHHPYAGPRESPRTPPPGGIRVRAVTLGNISVLIKELTRLYGHKQLWITEYGYQTSPQDPDFGVSWAKQAKYLSQAFAIARANPRIDMMVWFMLRDDPRVTTGWQSGLFTLSGRRKPSWSAMQRVFH
jgi:hypothetical protein